MELASCHILVTRPEPLASRWADQLRGLKAEVTVQPMMAIQPLTDDEAKQKIINHILSFDEYDGAIFISQNAVEHGFPWLDNYWPQLPTGVNFFAIGKTTAQALVERISDLGIYEAEDAMNSEALLEHPQLQAIEGQKIIIFKGEGGRDYLEQQLLLRGATVRLCELYQRQAVTYSGLNSAFRNTTKTPVVTVHSGETLTNLYTALGEDDLAWLQQQILLVPGQRVAAQASELGFNYYVTAKNATHESMIEALKEALKEAKYE